MLSSLITQTPLPPPPHEQIGAAAAEHPTQLIWHAQVSAEALRVDAAVRTLMPAEVSLTPLWGNTLYEKDQLPFGLEAFPYAFAEYFEAIDHGKEDTHKNLTSAPLTQEP